MENDKESMEDIIDGVLSNGTVKGEKAKENKPKVVRKCRNPKRECGFVFPDDQKSNVCPECGHVYTKEIN